ncbi:hypothetical protein K438DRAFT_1811013 [Mycena galopus ATCC 62051]|nr:hypothetical protein K438DRAFT_1811013 [Mycena galopus ATCC 62051]
MPRVFSWSWRVIILAMWAATALGVSINMTSPDPLPAGGTVVVVWARDNGVVTPNPSQFGLYVFADADNSDTVVVSQIVNAGSQPSGTVTMVMPPETSPGLYDIYAFQGADRNTPPALWGWDFTLDAAAQSASTTAPGATVTSNSVSQTSSGDPPSSTGLSQHVSASQQSGSQTPSTSTAISNSGSQTLSGNPQTLSGASQSIPAPTKPSASNSSPSNTNSATSAGAATGGSSSAAIVLTTKHAIPTGAMAGIVVGLLLTLVGIALLLLFLRRRRQRVLHRFSAPETNHQIDPSTPLPVITPFTSPPTMTQAAVPIREKDTGIGSFNSELAVSASGSSSASGGSSQLPPGTISEREHRERVERLEREVQLLRQQQQQQNVNFNEPPPEYNTL